MTRPGTLGDLHARFGWLGVLVFATGMLVWSAAAAVAVVNAVSWALRP